MSAGGSLSLRRGRGRGRGCQKGCGYELGGGAMSQENQSSRRQFCSDFTPHISPCRHHCVSPFWKMNPSTCSSHWPLLISPASQQEGNHIWKDQNPWAMGQKPPMPLALEFLVLFLTTEKRKGSSRPGRSDGSAIKLPTWGLLQVAHFSFTLWGNRKCMPCSSSGLPSTLSMRAGH